MKKIYLFICSLIFVKSVVCNHSWLVSIQGKANNESDDKYAHICAGAFLKSGYVLTAARCVDRRRNTTTFRVIPKFDYPSSGF